MATQEITQEFAQFLAWEAVSRDVVTVKGIYIDMADGDHAAGIFLSQLVYWYLKLDKDGKRRTRIHRDGHWWVAKSRDEWNDEIRLRPRQYDRVTKKLRKLGIIDTASYKFAGRPIAHVRIIIPKFMEVWKELAQVDLSGLPDTVKSTSPNGEVHIQRLTQDSSSNSSELDDKEDLVVAEKEACDDCCDSCGRTDSYAKKLPSEVDPKERCAWCFVLDGWAHAVESWNDRQPPGSPNRKAVPKRNGTGTSEKLRKKAHARMAEKEFRETWIYAINRAAHTRHLMIERWFTLEFFLRNDENPRKVATGFYDSWNKQNFPTEHAELQAWLAHKQAGLAGEPERVAGWSQFGGG